MRARAGGGPAREGLQRLDVFWHQQAGGRWAPSWQPISCDTPSLPHHPPASLFPPPRPDTSQPTIPSVSVQPELPSCLVRREKASFICQRRPPFPASSSSRFLFLARLPAVSFLRPHTPLCPISRLLPQFWPSSLGPRLCELAGPDCLHCIKRKKSISGSQRFLLSRTSSDFVHPNDIANLPSDQTNHPQSAVPHISIRHLPALYVRSSRWPLPDHRDLPTRHSGQAKVSL